MGIEDFLMGPSTTNAEEILKLIAKYKAMDAVGDMAVHHFTKDDELERLQREDLKLKIAGEKRDLGMQYGDDDDYQNDENHLGRTVIARAIGRKFHSSPAVATSNPLLQAMFKTARAAPEKSLPSQGLQAIFKTAYHEPLTPKEATNGLSRILRSIGR